MTSSAIHEPDRRPRAVAAAIEGSVLRVSIVDGRELLIPINWFPWLASAGAADRSDISIDEGGLSLWWGRLDDGLSVPRLFGLPEWP